MLDVAIICSVIPERFHLFQRSVYTWRESIRESGLRGEIFAWLDDFGGVQGVNYPTPVAANLPILQNLTLTATQHKSGSHITGYNDGYERVQYRGGAKTFIFTHPEMLFPGDTVRVAHEQAQDDVFVAFKCFWLSPDMTNRLSEFSWYTPEELEKESMLFELDGLTKGSFYANRTARNIKVWQSTTTFAYNGKTAARVFPFPDLHHQGYDDPLHAGLRDIFGIRNYTVQDPMLFHQWHPNTWTGTGEEAVAEATQLLNEFRERLKV